jgi:hypothetical protein
MVLTRKRKREQLREAVWGNKQVRGIIFSFYVSPTRVYMSRRIPLPYLSDQFFTYFSLIKDTPYPWIWLDSPAYLRLHVKMCPAWDDIREHQNRVLLLRGA